MMEDGKTRSGHRERRSKVRLSDVHRLVDDVVTKHMPDKAAKSRTHHEGTHHEGHERRKSPRKS